MEFDRLVESLCESAGEYSCQFPTWFASAYMIHKETGKHQINEDPSTLMTADFSGEQVQAGRYSRWQHQAYFMM